MTRLFASKRSLTVIVLSLAILLVLPFAFAQETTAGIQGTVKDSTGAVVAKATVEVTSPALIGVKKVETDSAGNYRISNLPPGEYSVTVSASGFKTYKQAGIALEVGRLPSIDIALQVGATAETIEVTGAAPLVDSTTSKASINIPEQVINDLPKSRQFYSLISFAPGARQEPLQSNSRGTSGFQIDGASDGENAYLIEGMDTTDIQSGGIGQIGLNLNTDFVQEVQIKSSGFEAEYGGALGGVINVIQKRGGNDWHGTVFTYFRGNQTYASDYPTLRLDPSTRTNAATRTSALPQYYQPKEDKWRILEPGFTAGGYLVKDKLWLFTGFNPNLYALTRTVKFRGFTGSNLALNGTRSFPYNDNVYNWQTRLDGNLSSKLHLWGSWVYGFERGMGTSLPGADSPYGQLNNSATTDPRTFNADIGFSRPDSVWQFGGDWQINSRLIVTGRYGYWFSNYHDLGLPTGIRYQSMSQSTVTQGFDGTAIPSTLQVPRGWANISSNYKTLYDANTRKQMSYDVSYFKSGWGTHNFKFGYSNNRLGNSVNQGYDTSRILLYEGEGYSPNSAAGVANCAPLVAQYGVCAGNYGYYDIYDYSIFGNVASYNHSLYAQDAWTVGKGLTLNIGLRVDKETVPPYTPGASSIAFGFQDKLAPRIGGAYDVLHNGKWKIYASYGKFFDIMKYGLPRGSFGGEYWHDCVYSLDSADYTLIQPTRSGAHYCPGSGTRPGTFIEEFNWRAVIIDPTNPGVDPNIKPLQQHEMIFGSDYQLSSSLGLEVRYARKRLDRAIEDNGIDIGGAEVYFIGNPGYGIVSNLLQKDVKDSTALPFITYPAQCPSCPLEPRAERRYDGVEVRLNKRYGHNWFGQLSYTYSKLRGNYSGLTSTGLYDTNSAGALTGGGGGRHTAGNGRAFDLPQMQFTTFGQVMDGPLGTDRPNALKLFGSYHLKWLGRQETTVGLGQMIYSGTPNSTVIPAISSSSAVQFMGQPGTWVNMHRDASGNMVQDATIKNSRTPGYTQTDLQVTHEFRVSKTNENLKLAFNFNVTNLLNQHAKMGIVSDPIGNSAGHVEPLNAAVYTLTPGADPTKAASYTVTGGDPNWPAMTMTGWDPVAWMNNPNPAGIPAVCTDCAVVGKTFNALYGMGSLFQVSRRAYVGVKFEF